MGSGYSFMTHHIERGMHMAYNYYVLIFYIVHSTICIHINVAVWISDGSLSLLLYYVKAAVDINH